MAESRVKTVMSKSPDSRSSAIIAWPTGPDAWICYLNIFVMKEEEGWITNACYSNLSFGDVKWHFMRNGDSIHDLCVEI